MLYTGREQNPRVDPARAPARGRSFARRIDCADGGEARPPVNPDAGARIVREPPHGHGARRQLDID